MGAISDFGTGGLACENILNALFAQTTWVATTTPIRCRLMTANGSATGGVGTELATSGGYTAGTTAPAITYTTAASTTAGGATIANTSQWQVTNMPAATIVGVELWDSNATARRLAWGALTATKTTNSGDTFTITAGALTVALT